jgi:Holliday junction resolvase RusA-like endonuclease
VAIEIYYSTRRSDLDESIILDAMQGFIYANDRQIKSKFVTWGLDRDYPRAEIKIAELVLD